MTYIPDIYHRAGLTALHPLRVTARRIFSGDPGPSAQEHGQPSAVSPFTPRGSRRACRGYSCRSHLYHTLFSCPHYRPLGGNVNSFSDIFSYFCIFRGTGVLKSSYHQLTRTHTVLTGRKTPMPPQSPCQYTKYCLRAFHCLNAFLLRQNCLHLTALDFSSDFCFLRRRRADARQGEKGKKRRKDMLSGVCALVN